MKKEDVQHLLGYVVSILFATVIIALLFLLADNFNVGTLLGWSTFLVIPFIMGMICAWFWRYQNLRTLALIGRLILNMLLSMLFAAIFLKEGIYCLLIVSPLIFAMMIIGYYTERALIRRKNNRLNFSTGILIFAVVLVDMLGPHQFENSVSDTMIIHAPPSAVWTYVVAYPTNHEKSDYWFFNIGLPRPMETTVSAYCKGAGRKCIFEKNLVFDEVMSTYQPDTNLTFDVTAQPKDPEIMGHINIERGQFLLKDNHDGTTTLTGTSWYSLNVFPATYFDLWAESITRNVHLRVMEHIKHLCEKKL